MSRYSGDVRGRNEIVVLTRDQATERAVTLGAEGDGQVFGRVSVCRDLGGLEAELARRPQTRVALVDLDPQPMALLSGLESLVRRHATTRFVVICSEFENQVVLEAMQIGARNCLLKSSLASDLVGVLRRLIDDSEAPAPRARGGLVSILTASGGAGGTTLAVNLADELRRLPRAGSEGRGAGNGVLLVDLDLDYGAAAAYLGLNPEYGVVDVLGSPGSIDAQLIRSTASVHADSVHGNSVHSDDLHVLTSPASGQRAAFAAPGSDEPGFDKLETMLNVCREAYSFTIVDAPRLGPELSARLAIASDLVLVVFQLSVIDVRSARAILRGLADRGLPPERAVPVANRWSKRSRALSLEDARDAFGGVEPAHLSNDYESALRSINFGQPLSQVAPRSPLRRDVAELAVRVDAARAERDAEREAASEARGVHGGGSR